MDTPDRTDGNVEFVPEGRTPSTASLRGGFQYENLVVLMLCVMLFKSGSDEHVFHVEQRKVHPFDDVVLKSGGQVSVLQVKRNADGSLEQLAKSLSQKSSEKSKVFDKSLSDGYERAVAAHLSMLPDGLQVKRWMEWPCVGLTRQAVEELGLPKGLVGALLIRLPSETEMRRSLSEWFRMKHGVGGERLLDSAIAEVDGIFRSPDPQRRTIGVERALALLGLQWRRIQHNVHDPSKLIKRPRITSQVLDAFETGKSVVILGEPGIGKSALIDQLVTELETHRKRAIRYSCFVSPDDEFKVDRLDPEFFKRELAEGESLVESYHKTELRVSEVVQSIGRASCETYVLIDGLDHVKRSKAEEVHAEFGNLLALLAKQKNVRLAVAVQSLDQLPDQVRSLELIQVQVPRMATEEISDVTRILVDVEAEAVRPDSYIVQKLHDFSSGNPLLLTYALRLTAEVIREWDYKEFERLLGTAKFSDVKGYLRTLLVGLKPGQKYLLRALCQLVFGFEQSSYRAIGKSLCGNGLEVEDLWSSVSHIFRQVGPSRYQVWHYSLEEVLEEDGVHLDAGARDVKSAIMGLGESVDESVYKAWFELADEQCNYLSIVGELVADGLDGRIRSKEALKMVTKAAVLAGKGKGFSDLIKIGLESYSIQLLYGDRVSLKGAEAVGLGCSRLVKPSILYYGNGADVLKLLGLCGSIGKVIASSRELTWLIDDCRMRKPAQVAGTVALDVIEEKLDLEEAIRGVANTLWRFEEGYEGKFRSATPEENREANQTVGYELGRMLALNADATVMCCKAWHERLGDVDALSVASEMLVGGAEVYLSRGANQDAKKCADALLKIGLPVSEEGLYIAALLGARSDKKAVREALSNIRAEEVVEGVVSYTAMEENAPNRPLRRLIALAGAARESRADGIWSIIESSLKNASAAETPVTAARNAAIMDVVDFASRNGQSWQAAITELESTLNRRRLQFGGYYVFHYAHRVAEVLEECIDIGTMPVQGVEDFKSLKALQRLDIRLAEVDVLAGRCDLPQLGDTLEVVEKEQRLLACESPDNWQKSAAKLGAMHMIRGVRDKAEHLALEAYRLRHRYGYHKDTFYYQVLKVLQHSAAFLGWGKTVFWLQSAGEYMPVIDVVTDGDETRHWFVEFMEFVCEPVPPGKSRLFAFVEKRIRHDSDDWIWLRRSQALFQAMLDTCELEVQREWLGVIRDWTCYGAPNRVREERRDMDFCEWAAANVRGNALWNASAENRSLKNDIHGWGEHVLRTYSAEIEKAQGEKLSEFGMSFGAFIRAVELMLGREPSFPARSYEDYSSSQQVVESLSREKLRADNISATMRELNFWLSSWWGCKPVWADQIVDKLRSMGDAGADIALQAYLDFILDKGAFMIESTPQLARVLGELGLLEELEILADGLVGLFRKLFPLNAPDEEFGRALAGTSFRG